jgi:tetratricopeptide (TPR) repeat protein
MHTSIQKIIFFAIVAIFSSAALAGYANLPKLPRGPELPYPLVSDYISGGYAVRHSDHELAARIFLEALKKEPKNQIIMRNAYTSLLAIGKVNESVDIAKEYQKKDATDPALSVLLATYDIKNSEFARSGDDLDSAARTAQMSIPSSVGMVIIPFLKLWTMVGQGKFDEALQYQNVIMGKREPSLFVRYQSALIYDIKGDSAKAEENYAELVKDGVVVPYYFANAAGNFYERMGKTAQAKAIYEKFRKQPTSLDDFRTNIENIDKGEVVTKKLVPNAVYGFNEVLKEAIRILNTSGFYEDAITYLRLSLYLNPDDEETNTLLAAYFDQRSEFNKSIAIYKRIDKKSDFYVSSRLAMSNNYYSEGKKRPAVRELIRIAGRDNLSGVALLTLADILRRDMKYNIAISVYNNIIENISHPETKDWPIFFARGVCNERAGNWDASERDLLMALQLKPNQPDLLNYLGYSWIERNKNLNDAKNMVAAAVKAKPDDGQIVDSMGWALFKINDYDSASKFLERATELMPYDAVVNDHLGDSYWKQGRFKEARFQWNRVLKYNNSEDISEKKIHDKLKNGLPVSIPENISPPSDG